MSSSRVVICDYDIITSFGQGIAPLWDALLNNRTSIAKVHRFDTTNFSSSFASMINDLDCQSQESLFLQLLDKFSLDKLKLKDNTKILLATSKGEIDLLERELRDNKKVSSYDPQETLKRVKDKFSFKQGVAFISAACASSSLAIAEGARLIEAKEADSVLVLTSEIVTPFIFSGFSSLLALDEQPARPFCKYRKGLTLGEGAGFMLLMSEEAAKKDNRNINGVVSGWGSSSDANHATGPSRDGSGLKLAIERALKKASIDSAKIDSISAHGTGTIYNDLMEIQAFKSVFQDDLKPVYSIKGATGHLLGASGLIETVVALKSMEDSLIPDSVNMTQVDEEMKGFVSKDKRQFVSNIVLNTNSGFGGINSALIIGKYE